MIIIMEYIPGGDLGKMINEVGPIPEFETKTIAKQLLDALGYLHKMNITHRDVKPDNILVNSREPFVVKLTDFGLSKMIDNDQTFLRTFCGTLLYCAPEVYSEYADYDEYGRRDPRNRRFNQVPGQRYDHAVDVWSLGGVLFYALTKRPPFPAKSGASHSELLHQIMTKPLDTYPLARIGVSQIGIDFLAKMLDRRPESRANVESLQSHPWINDPGLSQSYDEISDEELHVEASQLSLQDYDRERTVDVEDDVIIPNSDCEDMDESEVNDENQFSGYESEKENYTFGPGAWENRENRPQPNRLFGEVNASAMGSSGAVAAERLNIPISATSSATTQILGGVTEIRDSFDSSDDSLTPRQKSQKSQRSQPTPGDLRASALLASQNRSVENLNNTTFNIASQSLGGAESYLENLNMKSRAGSLLRGNSDLNSSKRKPSPDSSDEIEPPSANDRRGLKRFRSEAFVNAVSELPSLDEGDYELFAHIPSIARLQSARQIDNPVHKSAFWVAQDRKTWHLQYPEMTQLQFDAFKTAAAARNEVFAPGKTPLWDLALKYFPATRHERIGSETVPTSENGDDDVMPSTAILDTSSQDDIPDTQDPGRCIPLPVQWDSLERRIVATLQSAPAAAVANISVHITESMVSWGRAMENTKPYPSKFEAKVPKYAFKIILWKENYDPCRNFRPWNRAPELDENRFHFYISTKATNGIWVNDVQLPSDNPKNPGGPPTHWMRLHDNDSVVVWQPSDGSSRSELIFRCNWGGSGQPRCTNDKPRLLPGALAKRLDELCVRAEKKMHGLSEHDLRMEEANYDCDERKATIEEERNRSRAFELKRQEACRALATRRGSPAPYGGGHGESLATTQNTWLSQVPNRTVPQFRTGSPSTIGLVRNGRR